MDFDRLRLTKAVLELGSRPHKERAAVVCLAGSGGKTTLMGLLGAKAREEGLGCAMLTTTHIAFPHPHLGLELVANHDPGKIAGAFSKGDALVVGAPAEQTGKLTMPEPRVFSLLLRQADLLLVEADGSRRLPLKYPGPAEPVLPAETDLLLLTAGLPALGKPLEEVCHRAELLCAALGLSPQAPVTPEIFSRIIAAGYLKFRPGFLLLCGADDPQKQAQYELCASILRETGFPQVQTCDLLKEGDRCLLS